MTTAEMWSAGTFWLLADAGHVEHRHPEPWRGARPTPDRDQELWRSRGAGTSSTIFRRARTTVVRSPPVFRRWSPAARRSGVG